MQNKKEKSVESSEQNFQERIIRKEGESQSSYLHRAEQVVTEQIKKIENKGMLFDPTRTNEKDLPVETIDLISEIIEKTLENINVEATKLDSGILKKIDGKVGYNSKMVGIKHNSDNFDGTQRNRKFFEIQPGKGSAKRETYWNTLFFQYNTETTRELAKKILDDKKIILLGGGRSELLKELNENNIHPKSVLNIDPFVEDPNQDADKVVSLNACDKKLIEKLQARDITGADEIWAEFSVPAYLSNPQEIKQLISNIDNLLNKKGTARIWPLMVANGGSGDEMLARKDALVESIKNLITKEEYEISIYKSAGKEGLILHKI